MRTRSACPPGLRHRGRWCATGTIRTASRTTCAPASPPGIGSGATALRCAPSTKRRRPHTSEGTTRAVRRTRSGAAGIRPCAAIGSILAINLDRQPLRWRRLLRELGRFRTATGAPLATIVRRLSAVDASDGRAVAATADVDAVYRIGDQLFVQPDARLAECFGTEHPIRMTRQEVAVARSHVEAWKAIAAGPHRHVLVIEDDVWFRRGAARAIELGWRAALRRRGDAGGPHLLYLSFKDANGMATRTQAGDALFRPVGGLWFLSGYVLSRDGAAALLRAMPVVGPVDLWMNYRFAELGALALTRPAILQREDGLSDNVYSILPFLARAGTVDAGAPPVRPERPPNGLTVAWTAGEGEGLAMALSMLGLRTRAFAGSEPELSAAELAAVGEVFDAVVDPRADGRRSAADVGQRLLQPRRRGRHDWFRLPRLTVPHRSRLRCVGGLPRLCYRMVARSHLMVGGRRYGPRAPKLGSDAGSAPADAASRQPLGAAICGARRTAGPERATSVGGIPESGVTRCLVPWCEDLPYHHTAGLNT